LPRISPLRLLAALVLGLGLFLSTASVWATPAPVAKLLDQAKEAAGKGQWLEACKHYDELLRLNPRDASLRAEYQKCLRRLQLITRHGDPDYRKTLAKLTFHNALETLELVLHNVNAAHADRARAEFPTLIKQGLEEASFALDDPAFCQHYLPGVKRSVIDSFRGRLAQWSVGKITRPSEGRELVRAIVVEAKDELAVAGVFANALVMEFAIGACNGLDENSCFLTPSHLKLLQGGGRKQGHAGFLVDDNRKVTHVFRNGPAAAAKIAKGDEILSVGGQSVEKMTKREEVNALLVGKIDAPLTVKFLRGDNEESVQLKLRAVSLPGVEWETFPIGSVEIGYLRINYFTDDTLREVKDALGHIVSQSSIKGLILDLRGNPGGSFDASVKVAELFLSGGVISVAQSPLPDFNRSFEVKSPGSVQFPMVVLIDGETASAAEVLAAALKEGRTSTRPQLMGQTTYGKGSIQCLIQLKRAPLDKTAGIRLTVAKLFTPSNVPINGKGVAPDEELELSADPIEEAKAYFRKFLDPMGMMTDRELAMKD
jgi:carboxyl-terminal processing protease